MKLTSMMLPLALHVSISVGENHSISTVVDGMPVMTNEMVIGDQPMTFPQALSYCEDMEMELVSIHSEGAFDDGRDLCNSVDLDGSVGCWVGLVREEAGKPWYWTDGSDVDFGFDGNGTAIEDPWHPNEPNDWDGLEECVHYFTEQGMDWNDIACDSGALSFPLCTGTRSATAYPTQEPTTSSPTSPTSTSPTTPSKVWIVCGGIVYFITLGMCILRCRRSTPRNIARSEIEDDAERESDSEAQPNSYQAVTAQPNTYQAVEPGLGAAKSSDSSEMYDKWVYMETEGGVVKPFKKVHTRKVCSLSIDISVLPPLPSSLPEETGVICDETQ